MSIQLPEIPEPINPPVGQWEFFIDQIDQNLKLKDSSGTVINLTNLNVNPFGTNFQEVSDDTITTTTSVIFTNKLRLTTPELPVGSYRIEWNYQWNYGGATTDFVANVSNNTTVDLYMEHRQEPKDTGGSGPGGTDQRHQVSGFAVRTLSGVNEIDINYSSGSNGVVAAIWNARLTIWRVS